MAFLGELVAADILSSEDVFSWVFSKSTYNQMVTVGMGDMTILNHHQYNLSYAFSRKSCGGRPSNFSKNPLWEWLLTSEHGNWCCLLWKSLISCNDTSTNGFGFPSLHWSRTAVKLLFHCQLVCRHVMPWFCGLWQHDKYPEKFYNNQDIMASESKKMLCYNCI